MKKILLMLAILPAGLFAQEKYVIKGKTGAVNPPAKVFLMYDAGTNQMVTDSATVKNGVFEFTGQLNEITLAQLVMDYKGTGLRSITSNPDLIPVYLEKGTITVSSADSLSKAKITGTEANEDYMRYLAIVKPSMDAIKALSIEYNTATPEQKSSKEFIASIKKKQTDIQQQANEVNNRFITENPAASISLQILIDRMNTESYPDAADLQDKFSKLSENLRKSAAGITFQKKIDVDKAIMTGAIAPDFEQPDSNGKPVKLSSFRGKYVLVDFWASWCGPCRNENPNLVKAYRDFKGSNFTILGVSLDKPGKKTEWLKAIHSDGLDWNQVSDLKGWDNDAAVSYGVKAIPQNLLIDPDGKIIAKNIFGADLEKKLAEVLRKS